MRLLQRRGRNNSAFTIVELIVVIAVIGILAGIVIVGYSGWRAATTATQVKNDLNTAAQAMESARTFNNAYPTTLPSITTSSTHITLTLASGSTAAAYCIDGVSSDSPSNPYYVAFESKDQGPLAGTCATRTNVPVPAVPASLAVTSSNDTSISMSWGATTYAATYTLQCATDLGFVNGVVSTSQSGLTGTVSSLSPSTIYYCHINAVDGAGASAWSTSVSTTTKNPPFSTIVAGTGTTYAIRTDGSLWAWGRNDYGQVGNNSNASQLTPIKVISSGVSQVVASNYYMAYAIKTDGSLWAWGRNYNGAIGNNSTTDQLTPLKIISSGVSKVVSLSFTTYIIKTDGSLWAWGRGDYAQIGNGATVDQLTPVQIISSGVSQVVAGSYAAYAVKTDGSLWSWGYNGNGSVGNNSTTIQTTPVQVISSGVSQIQCGNTYTPYVLKSDGSVWSWGSNSYGQVGNNTTTTQLAPVQVLSSVSKIFYNNYSAYAIKTDGSLWAWGYNASGQIGNNSTTNQLTPVQVISSGVTQGISGLTTVYAVKSDGSLWAWGNNASGQIGNNSTTNQLTPLQVVSSGVSQVLSGYYMITYGYTTYIVKTDNSLWAWGNSAYSQSGNGTSANQLTPLQLLTNVSNGTYGYYTVEAVKSDGSLWAWGLNNYGTVGNNASSNQPTAVQIP